MRDESKVDSATMSGIDMIESIKVQVQKMGSLKDGLDFRLQQISRQ